MLERLGDDFQLARLANGWQVGEFPRLRAMTGVSHLVSTRIGLDVQRVRTDHAHTAGELARAMDLESVAWVEQVHGNDVFVVEQGGLAGNGDGLLTRTPGVGLAVRSADCTLILIADPASGVVGAAHASWRGTVKQIAAGLVDKAVAELGMKAESTIACICPSAGPCCYEVGQDVVDAAIAGIGPRAREFLLYRRDRVFFDLWAANVDQLLRKGLRMPNIHMASTCTMCRNDLFPSHRLEKEAAGRFVAAVGVRQE